VSAPRRGPAGVRAPLRVGIVGARFAADLHAHNYRPLRGGRVELTAVCARTRAEAEAFARRHEIARVFTDYRALAESADVDVVDICATTDVHHEIAVAAARAGKHVIVEKPLTGYFGDAGEPPEKMLEGALRHADAVLEAVGRAGVTLCYAEDFVYAPPVAKLRRLLDAGAGAILELRAEESHSGSHAAYARRWRTSGGGSLLRMGSHPVGVVLHLKHWEGRRSRGRPIRARSVIADVARLTALPQVAERRRHLRAAPEDVEDWAVAVITFEDGTKATVHSTDVSLGGVRNTVSAWLTNGVVHANITPNTAVVAYAPEAGVWGDESITEKVETTAGWQFPSPEEDWMRGYPQELLDFVDAIAEGREPLAGALLARETVEVIYAGYLAAATGRRVELDRP
jgi:predicted dehydrogenase